MKRRAERLLRTLALVLFGLTAAITQVIFLREFLVVASGNELLLGIFFACWFAGIMVGALATSWFADRVKRHREWTQGLLVLQVALLPMIVYLIRSFRLTMDVPTGQYISFGTLLLGAGLYVMPFSIITGIAFPLFCKWLEKERAGEGESIGNVYVYESVGSVVGGVIYTYYFVIYWNTFTTVFVVGLLMSLCCVALTVSTEGKGKVLRAIVFGVVAAGFVTVLVTGLNARVERFSVEQRWKAIGAGMGLVRTTNSKYENLVLGRQAGQYSVVGNGEFFSSFPDEYGDAIRVNFIMMQHPKAKRVLLIGGGDEALLPLVLRYPIERLDYVELDEKILALVEDFMPGSVREALADKRVVVHHVDGRYFVKAVAAGGVAEDEKYDLVIVSVPEPSTAVINRFYTRDFFSEVRKVLKSDGVFATSIGSAVNYFGDAVINYAGSVYKSLREVFGNVVMTPGEKAYLFASPRRGVVTTDIATLVQRYEESGIETPYFSKYAFYTLLQPEQVALVRRTMEEALPRTAENTDLRPITYFYNLMLWATFSGSKTEWFFRAIQKITLARVAVVLAVIFLARLIYVRMRAPGYARMLGFNAGFLIVATGFAGMASEIILLYLFQNIYGYIYQKVGLIVALFMVGLAVGSFVTTRALPKEIGRLLRTVAVFEVLIIAYFGALVLLISWLTGGGRGGAPGWYAVEIAFYGFVMMSGFLMGAEFPLVGQIFLLCRKKTGVSAAFVDSADHFGAGLGAFCAGVMVVPILGIVQSLVMLMLLKATGLGLLLTSFPPAETGGKKR